MSDIQNKQTTGHVNIINLQIRNYKNRTTIPSDLIEEIDLYEDIFSNCMSGHVNLKDAAGFLNALPLIGEEYIDIEFSHQDDKNSNRVLKKSFYIYKLDGREFTAQRCQKYTLHFISKEYIISSNLSVSESFKGKISNIITDIATRNTLLGIKDQIVYVEPTQNSYQFISPSWKPFAIINWLAKKAMNDRGVANYLFFESSQTYEFVPVDKLLGSEPIRFYRYADIANFPLEKNESNSDKKSFVKRVEPESQYNYLRSLAGGMYGGELVTLDMIFKKATIYDYDYLRDFDKANHLEKHPMNTPELIRSRVANNIHLIENAYLYGSSNKSQKYGKSVLQNISLMEQLNVYKLKIHVPGSLDVKVGSVIDFTLPDFDAYGKSQSREITDQFRSGKYLITAIRHGIVANEHTMVMEIVKDSVMKILTENVE